MRTWIFICLLVVAACAEHCVIEDPLDLPNLLLCGAEQQSFCSRLSAALQPPPVHRCCSDTAYGDICTSEEGCNALGGVFNSSEAPASVCYVSEQCGSSAPAPLVPATLSEISSEQAACMGTPAGSLLLIQQEDTCPCGFTDVTDDFGERYIAVGTGAELAGSVGSETVASRQGDFAGAVDGAAYASMAKHASTVGMEPLFKKPSASSNVPTTTTIRSTDVAPAAVFKLCKRNEECLC